MVPEISSVSGEMPVRSLWADADALAFVKALCTMVAEDRLSGVPESARTEKQLDRVEQFWQAAGAVVLDVYLEHSLETLVESWLFTAMQGAAPAKGDIKLVIKSMLCYSRFHAWRRECDPKELACVRVAIGSPQTRRSFGEHPFTRQTALPVALGPLVLNVDVERLNAPIAEFFPEISEIETATRGLEALAVAPHAPLTIPVVSKPRAFAPLAVLDRTPPGSPIPPRAALDSAPISIPRSRSRLATSGESALADGRIAPSPTALGSVDHRGVFLKSPAVFTRSRSSSDAGRHGSFSRSLSTSRTPPTQMLGSFEESLLNGRLPAAAASAVRGFILQVGASGIGPSPRQLRVPLSAMYYTLPGEETPTPYVGVVDLGEAIRDEKHPGMYRVPAAGLIQVVVCNPEKTGIKVFVVKYDFKAMPPCTHTFLRQRTYVSASPTAGRGALKYAIHLRFVSSKRGHIYLYKDIRVVFSHLAPDKAEFQRTTTEGPTDPVFTPCDPQRITHPETKLDGSVFTPLRLERPTAKLTGGLDDSQASTDSAVFSP
eukprot:m.30804 g.30804  ORF g.30804 m.30804 type:complete len:544 (+) comp4815_c0_seq1:64-1695(+)